MRGSQFIIVGLLFTLFINVQMQIIQSFSLRVQEDDKSLSQKNHEDSNSTQSLQAQGNMTKIKNTSSIQAQNNMESINSTIQIIETQKNIRSLNDTQITSEQNLIQNQSAQNSRQQSLNDELEDPIYDVLDVGFVLDTTGSMSAQIAQVKGIIQNIILSLKKKVSITNLQLRFGVVAYRDHPPQDTTYVTKINDFTNDYQTIKFVQTLQARGGGDRPQAVHNGLYDAATQLSWQQVSQRGYLRYIFHIADAAPHGSEFLNNGEDEGCLCGIQTDQVAKQINDRNIKYRLLKVRPYQDLNKMQQIFRQKITNFDSETIIEEYRFTQPYRLSADSALVVSRGGIETSSLSSKSAISFLSEPSIEQQPAIAFASPTSTSSRSIPQSKQLKYIVADYIIDDIVKK